MRRPGQSQKEKEGCRKGERRRREGGRVKDTLNKSSWSGTNKKEEMRDMEGNGEKKRAKESGG